MHDYEDVLYKQGYKYIGGIDEVGRGPLVGPVVAACVILPKDFQMDEINDSKTLSEKKRNYLYNIIKENAISIGIGIIDSKRIDEINIYEATKEAMNAAVEDSNIKPEYLLIDGNMKFDFNNYKSIIKGDSASISIAAASIIAKVTRDKMLYELDALHPEYDFKNNKGYPTKKHIEAITKYGIIKEHRKSFGPVKEMSSK